MKYLHVFLLFLFLFLFFLWSYAEVARAEFFIWLECMALREYGLGNKLKNVHSRSLTPKNLPGTVGLSGFLL